MCSCMCLLVRAMQMPACPRRRLILCVLCEVRVLMDVCGQRASDVCPCLHACASVCACARCVRCVLMRMCVPRHAMCEHAHAQCACLYVCAHVCVCVCVCVCMRITRSCMHVRACSHMPGSVHIRKLLTFLNLNNIFISNTANATVV